MLKDDRNLIIIFFLLGILTRIPLVEKMLSHTDASSYVLAIINYNLLQETPAPPGYPLYFALGTFINLFLNNPYHSLVFISVLFSGICAVVFYIAGNSFGGRKMGVLSSLIFLTSPSFYFYGLIVFPFIMVIPFLVLLYFCVYGILFKSKNYGYLLGLVYALLLGIRPQELLLTLPLFLLGIYGLEKTERMKAMLTFLFISLAWFVPFLITVGGLGEYMRAARAAAGDAIPGFAFSYFLTKKFEFASNFYLTLGIGSIFLLIFLIKNAFVILNQKKKILNKKLIIYYIFWLTPVIIFNLFIRTESGYQLGYLIFLLFAISYSVTRLFTNNFALVGVSAMIILLNLSVFFQDRDPNFEKPYRQVSFHYSDLRRNEFELANKISYIKSNFSPEKSIIIADPYFWRHFRYYLPEYQILKIESVYLKLPEGKNQITFAKNFKFIKMDNSGKKIFIPSNINNIIFIDNNSSEYVKEKTKTEKFKGISKLVILPLEQNRGIIFDYHNIHFAD